MVTSYLCNITNLREVRILKSNYPVNILRRGNLELLCWLTLFKCRECEVKGACSDDCKTETLYLVLYSIYSPQQCCAKHALPCFSGVDGRTIRAAFRRSWSVGRICKAERKRSISCMYIMPMLYVAVCSDNFFAQRSWRTNQISCSFICIANGR